MKPTKTKRMMSRFPKSTKLKPYEYDFPSHVVCPECGGKMQFDMWMKNSNKSIQEYEPEYTCTRCGLCADPKYILGQKKRKSARISQPTSSGRSTITEIAHKNVVPQLVEGNWDHTGTFKIEFIHGHPWDNIPVGHWAKNLPPKSGIFVNSDFPDELVRIIGDLPEYGVYLFKKIQKSRRTKIKRKRAYGVSEYNDPRNKIPEVETTKEGWQSDIAFVNNKPYILVTRAGNLNSIRYKRNFGFGYLRDTIILKSKVGKSADPAYSDDLGYAYGLYVPMK